MFQPSIILLICLIFGEYLIALPSAHANNIQSSLSAGMSFFQADQGGLIGQTGYFLHFQTEERDKWIRPTYGGQIEFNFGGNLLVDGQMLGGIEVVADKAVYVKPFLGANALFGWATLSTSSATYVGFVYGTMLSTGAEIRFTQKDQASAVRITSEWRLVMGTIGGGLTGSNLTTLQISIGMTF